MRNELTAIEEKLMEMMLTSATGWFSDNSHTNENMKEFLNNFRNFPGASDELLVKAYDKISEIFQISMDGTYSEMSIDDGHEEWFNPDVNNTYDEEHKISWHYWKYYRDYLTQVKKMSPVVVQEIDSITSNILSKMEYPAREGAWNRRGLVMGSVQSGKTGNYTGLVAKAIDAGYKFIVILTGTHNSLRSQTQIRINEELLGYDLSKLQKIGSSNMNRVGVGKRWMMHKGRDIQTLTTSHEKGDFKRTLAQSVNPNLQNPHVMVIKKNVSIMKNLIEWAKFYAGPENKVKDVPMLIIDDECDQASVNTKKTEINDLTGEAIDEPTKTNLRIRELLNLFEKSIYVGYTATPFANIFINHQREHESLGQDLFPKDFIVSLNRPSNYIGPEEFFGLKSPDPEDDEPLPLTRKVTDSGLVYPQYHKKDLVIDNLPNSLKRSIKQFILSSVAKMIRKTSNPHNSMLIHVTRFTAVQSRTAELVREELQYLVGRIGSVSDELDDFRKIWEEDFLPTTKKMIQLGRSEEKQLHTWDEIKQNLPTIVRRLKVKEINGSAKDTLEYKEADDAADNYLAKNKEKLPWEKRGKHIIAIGGDKLSRGLTLEGLTVSYYLRPSKMYDTLMQMGRWFGYRSGYVDLCRIFTTTEIIDWFSQIASAEKDLKEQFDEMARIGAKPEEFGLAVQEDPGLLTVTNSGKRRDTERISISFSGRIPETTVLDPRYAEHNFEALKNLVRGSQSEGVRHTLEKQNLQWKGVPKQMIVDFLSSYKGHTSGIPCKSISDFINIQQGTDLQSWDVVIINKKGSSRIIDLGIEDLKFGAVQRSCSSSPQDQKIVIKRIVSRTDEWLDFSQKERDEMLAEYKKKNDGKSITGRYIRGKRNPNRGLLIIYGACDSRDAKDTSYPYGLKGETPIYGFGVSFPANGNSIKKDFRANSVWQEQQRTLGEYENGTD